MDQDKEKAKSAFKTMRGKEKIAYIWQYYRIQMLVVVIIVVIIVSIIGRFTFNKPPEACLQLGFRSEYLDPDAIDALPQHLETLYPEMTENGEKVFTSLEFYAGYRAEQAQENEATYYKLAGSIAAGQVDVLIGDLDTLTEEANMDTYKDLREVFTEEELERINELASPRTEDGEGEGLVYLTYNNVTVNGRTESQVEDTPLLICISGCNENIDNCLAGDVGYLAIVNNTTNIENVKTLIWSLLGENVD